MLIIIMAIVIIILFFFISHFPSNVMNQLYVYKTVNDTFTLPQSALEINLKVPFEYDI